MTDFKRVITVGATSLCTFHAQITSSDWTKITFPKPFKNVPDIFASFDSHHNGTSPSGVVITDRTTTDCNILTAFQDYPVDCNFMIIGELAD